MGQSGLIKNIGNYNVFIALTASISILGKSTLMFIVLVEFMIRVILHK